MTTETLYVTRVYAEPRQGRQWHYEAWCRRPDKDFCDLVLHIWEEPTKAYKASICQRAADLQKLVKVSYMETHARFLRCLDVRFLEKADVSEASVSLPQGA